MSQLSSFKTSGGGSGTVTSITFNGGLTSIPDPVTTTGSATIDQTNLTVLDGTVYWDTNTQLLNTTGTGTAGQVLTSNGAGSPPSYQNGASGSITIDGDTGSATGSTITIQTGVATINSGSSIDFLASGSTVQLDVTDTSNNTIIGNQAGNATLVIDATANVALGSFALSSLTTGSNNSVLGYAAGSDLTSGNNNTAVGNDTITSLTSGSFNTVIGIGAGANYTSTESANIIINTGGVVGESNVLRIGDGTGTGNQQLSTSYISGINGNTVSNALMVTIDSVTDQLGVQSIPSGGSITIDGDSGSATGTTITFNAASQAGSSVSFSATGSTVSLNTSDANSNTIIGNSAGNPTISGSANMGFGTSSLAALTTGYDNVCMGIGTMGGATIDNNSIAIGTNALENVNGGSYNIGIGSSVLPNLVTGTNNIVIGSGSGAHYIGSESYNIILGPSLGTNSTSGEMWLGDFSNTSTTYIAGVSGTTVSNQNFVTIDTSTGQLGSTAGGGGSITIDGDSGSATGSTITFNAASQAGLTVNFSATGSTVSLNVTDGNQNTCVGLAGTLSGSNNTSLGSAAYTTGNDTAIGCNTYCGGNSVAIGNTASAYDTNCVSIGYGANSSNTSSIAIGSGASSQNGATSIAIGYNASISNNNGIAIGTSTFTTSANSIVIGTSVTDSNGSGTYISGIYGTTSTNPVPVYVDSTTNQLTAAFTNVFSAYVNAQQTNVTGAGTATTIIFDGVTSNAGSYYDNTTGIFTAPITGNYYFSVNVAIGGTSVAANRVVLSASAGSITYTITDSNFIQATASGEMFINGSFMARLNAIDTCQIIVQVSNGAGDTLTIDGSSGGSQYLSIFSGYYVSP